MRKQFTTKDNITLHYEVFGDEVAPVILLVMGLGMPCVAWPPEIIRGLVQKGFRVVVFDNRDSGRSTKIEEHISSLRVVGSIFKILLRMPVRAPYSLDDMAADAEAVLDELKIRRAHIMGISMGGMIAQVMGFRFPQRVASLISIMSASGNPRTGLGKLRAISGILAKPSKSEDLESVVTYLRKIFKAIGSPHFTHSDERLYAVAREMIIDGLSSEATARQLLAILSSGDRSEALPRIMAPTLVIHGKDDPLLPLRAGEEVARLIPNARLMTINKMGHDLSDEVISTIVSAVSQHCHRYKE